MARDECPLPWRKRGEYFGSKRLELFEQLFALTLRGGVLTHAGQRLDPALEIHYRLFEVFFFHDDHLACFGPSGIVELHA